MKQILQKQDPNLRQGRLPLIKPAGRMYDLKTLKTTKLLVKSGRTTPCGIEIWIPIFPEEKNV